jgi:hypothetical protein
MGGEYNTSAPTPADEQPQTPRVRGRPQHRPELVLPRRKVIHLPEGNST